MKAIIVGCGLIGVTTAYFLQRNGYEITVIDRAGGPGRETSFANGALLTTGMAEPWNTPGCWRALLGSLGRPDAAVRLRLRALFGMAGWGAAFLRNSASMAFERNARSNLRLAQHSLDVMKLLRQQSGIEYSRAARGSLKIFRDRATLDRALEATTLLTAEKVSFQRLTGRELIELEPALRPIIRDLVGAIHYENDETGDAYHFCVALAGHARQLGVKFHFLTEATALEFGSGQVTAVVTGRDRFVANQYIVAAGSYSTPLLRTVGIRLPVRPAKGYSVTFNTCDGQPSLKIPVIDDHWHAAVVPVDGAIRVAGTAEFAGYDLTLQPSRIRNLEKLLREVLPEAKLNLSAPKVWCGLRPMTADGVPIIGSTSISNLLVNTGHGHLGWTMAAGSGKLLADLVSGQSPAIDPTPYFFSRFRN